MQHQEELKSTFPIVANTPVVMEVPVLWGDMDSARHVNNLHYLRWSETARLILFEKMMDTSFTGDQGPILGWQDCKYIFPMTFPDTAIVTCGVKELLEDRFIVESQIYSMKHKRIAAISLQSILPYDYVELKKIPLPALWSEKLKQLGISNTVK
jgi:acyl-CoA thioester hydrolase